MDNGKVRNYDRLCLGTVQFGMDYGINNPEGRPTLKDALAILDRAMEFGVCCLDTARAYGEAESVLGEFIRTRRPGDGLRIVSKLRPDALNDTTADVRSVVLSELEISLRSLNVASLDVYMLHNPANMYIPGVMDALRDCREKGLIRSIGVSVYGMEDAIHAVEIERVDAVQFPFNILDARPLKSGFLGIAAAAGTALYARSVFLQGLLLMSGDRIPDHLKGAKDHLERLDSSLKGLGMTRTEAALQYVLSRKEIDYAVVGVDNIAHLEELVRSASSTAGNIPATEKLGEMFLDVDESIISPNLWSGMAKSASGK